MGARLRSWWQPIKQHPVAIVLIALLAVVIVMIILIILGYTFNWDWTGLNATDFTSTPQNITRTIVYQPGKTLWDWLGLLGVLAIPVVVGWLTFQQGRVSDANRKQQKETELQVATDNQREAALQAYTDKMSELLLHEQLRDSAEEDEVRKIARVRTLTVLRGLDPIRKTSVIQFLIESGLIDKDTCVISLSDADLSGTNLSNAILSGATLIDANLSAADLTAADLSGAKLIRAKLIRAKLSFVVLSGADLSYASLNNASLVVANLNGATLKLATLGYATLIDANLSGANLSNASLNWADLRGAKITQEQLEQAQSLTGATMPV
jgi:uncharacterized protein YjbI with pentapeptide repeats